MTERRIKPHIPIYKEPPNKFLRYEIEYWHDGCGHGGMVRIAHFINKSGKRVTADAQVIHNPDYMDMWKGLRNKLDNANYMLHYAVHKPMESFESIKPDENGLYHVVAILNDGVYDMMIDYSVYNGWAFYTRERLTGEYVETRHIIENAVGIKKMIKFG